MICIMHTYKTTVDVGTLAWTVVKTQRTAGLGGASPDLVRCSSSKEGAVDSDIFCGRPADGTGAFRLSVEGTTGDEWDNGRTDGSRSALLRGTQTGVGDCRRRSTPSELGLRSQGAVA